MNAKLCSRGLILKSIQLELHIVLLNTTILVFYMWVKQSPRLNFHWRFYFYKKKKKIEPQISTVLVLYPKPSSWGPRTIYLTSNANSNCHHLKLIAFLIWGQAKVLYYCVKFKGYPVRKCNCIYLKQVVKVYQVQYNFMEVPLYKGNNWLFSALWLFVAAYLRRTVTVGRKEVGLFFSSPVPNLTSSFHHTLWKNTVVLDFSRFSCM